MSEVLTNVEPAPEQTVVEDRRRPGRLENANPALIKLMRKPSVAARAQVALYDAPGFMLPSAESARLVRAPGFGLRVGVAVVASGIAWAVAFKVMCVVWG